MKAADPWTRPPGENPVELLKQANRILEAGWPTRRVVQFFQRHMGVPVWYVARFDFPGVVKVSCKNTGDLLAQSKPGRPTELASKWPRRAHEPRPPTKLAEQGAQRGRP